jgi:hypothetical protein
MEWRIGGADLPEAGGSRRGGFLVRDADRAYPPKLWALPPEIRAVPPYCPPSAPNSGRYPRVFGRLPESIRRSPKNTGGIPEISGGSPKPSAASPVLWGVPPDFRASPPTCLRFAPDSGRNAHNFGGHPHKPGGHSRIVGRSAERGLEQDQTAGACRNRSGSLEKLIRGGDGSVSEVYGRGGAPHGSAPREVRRGCWKGLSLGTSGERGRGLCAWHGPNQGVALGCGLPYNPASARRPPPAAAVQP